MSFADAPLHHSALEPLWLKHADALSDARPIAPQHSQHSASRPKTPEDRCSRVLAQRPRDTNRERPGLRRSSQWPFNLRAVAFPRSEAAPASLPFMRPRQDPVYHSILRFALGCRSRRDTEEEACREVSQRPRHDQREAGLVT